MGEEKEDGPESSSYEDKLPSGFCAVVEKKKVFKR